jgi:hypothetical protein
MPEDLVGRLNVFEPISVMQMLNLEQATGELELVTGKNTASVFFERGNVTFAGIANRPMKLGEYLVRDGVVSQAQLDGALKKVKRGKKLGTLLIEAGVITEDALRAAIKEQIKHVIYEIVRWHDGKFAFTSGKKPEQQDILIDIPLDHLMLEGLKRLDEERERTK